MTRFRGTDEGTTFQYLSHNGSTNGETNVNPSEESPHAFFDRLFNKGAGSPLVDRGARQRARRGERADRRPAGPRSARRTNSASSSTSRASRELEAAAEPAHRRVHEARRSGRFPGCRPRTSRSTEKNKAMSDLMALALSCGLTRSFSILYSTCGSGAVFWMVGATDGQHYMNHTEPAPHTKQARRGARSR